MASDAAAHTARPMALQDRLARLAYASAERRSGSRSVGVPLLPPQTIRVLAVTIGYAWFAMHRATYSPYTHPVDTCVSIINAMIRLDSYWLLTQPREPIPYSDGRWRFPK